MKRQNTLYLKVIHGREVMRQWGLKPTHFEAQILMARKEGWHLMVRCNRKGEINWETTAVYNFDELKGRKVMFL